jgi:hypothetical protein
MAVGGVVDLGAGLAVDEEAQILAALAVAELPFGVGGMSFEGFVLALGIDKAYGSFHRLPFSFAAGEFCFVGLGAAAGVKCRAVCRHWKQPQPSWCPVRPATIRSSWVNC